MKQRPVILIAEDDTGHFELVKRNLWRTCVDSEFMHFRDGQEVLNFFNEKASDHKFDKTGIYILILDIKMPRVDGREVLRALKQDENLRKIPVIMLTTTEDEEEVDACYKAGCNFYMHKPTDYSKFMAAVSNLGAFLSLEGLRVPPLSAV
jgi:CheY-like chemotaxis protein